MKIVVVGGSGWYGSHLVKALADKHDVVVIDPGEPLVPFGPEVKHVRYPIVSLLCGYRVDCLRGAGAVVSLPGQLGSVTSLEDPFGSVTESILPHLALLKILADNELAPTVVFSSSDLVYGEPARCLYTAHKKTVEDYLRIYSRAYGIPYVVLRTATTYGPFQRRDSVVNFFVRRALRGETIPVYADVVHDRLAIVYIDDVVNALALACEREDYKYHAYPVLACQPRVVDIANAVADSLGGEVALVETPDLVKSVGSGDLLVEDAGPPGWIPEVGLKEGISRTARWMRRHLTS